MDIKELKKEFKKVFFNTLKKHGFKRIKKKWVFETSDLIKNIDLQKSDYSDLYYLNYDFTVKGVATDPWVAHVMSRYGGDKLSRKVLDLETNLSVDKRLFLFEKMIDEMVDIKIKNINSIEDILQLIKENPINKNALSKSFKEKYNIKD